MFALDLRNMGQLINVCITMFGSHSPFRPILPKSPKHLAHFWIGDVTQWYSISLSCTWPCV